MWLVVYAHGQTQDKECWEWEFTGSMNRCTAEELDNDDNAPTWYQPEKHLPSCVVRSTTNFVNYYYLFCPKTYFANILLLNHTISCFP
jgi:hypothetical protein